jgi:glycosyltransferase involved in cell wall biosynthesis
MEAIRNQIQPPRLKKPVRITEQVWPEGTVPVVSVFNWAYNHAEFIRESIESILMQATTFPVEIIIHDDASTDGTSEIIRGYEAKYPKLFQNILQSENQWQKSGSVMAPLLSAPRGEYLALAHGDDYWTDPQKLQKQADYFQSNPGIQILCAEYLIRRGDLLMPPPLKLNRVVTFENWASPYSLSTFTAMFRQQDVVSRWPAKTVQHAKDIFLWRLLLQKGEAHVLPDCMAVYRVHRGGVWSLQNEFQQHFSNLQTARSMITHLGRQRDLRTFYSGALKACLRHLPQAGLEQLQTLIRYSCKSRPQAVPQLVAAWFKKRTQKETGFCRASQSEFPTPRAPRIGSPKFSVVVVTYRRPRELRLALEALEGQAGAPPHEVLIIDNDAESSARAVAAPFLARQVNWLYEVNSRNNVSLARNVGAGLARGEWLVFLDDDCVPGPDWLACAERILAAHPGPGLVMGGGYLPVVDRAAPLQILPKDRYLLEGNLFFPRKDYLDLEGMRTDLGPSSRRFGYHEGTELQMRHRKKFDAQHRLLLAPDLAVRHLEANRRNKALLAFLAGFDAVRAFSANRTSSKANTIYQLCKIPGPLLRLPLVLLAKDGAAGRRRWERELYRLGEIYGEIGQGRQKTKAR